MSINFNKLILATHGSKYKNQLSEIANYSGEIGLYILENNDHTKNSLIIITELKLAFINIPGYKLDMSNKYYSQKQLNRFNWNCELFWFQSLNQPYYSYKFVFPFQTANYKFEFSNKIFINIKVKPKRIIKFAFYPDQLSSDKFDNILEIVIFDLLDEK